MAAKKKEVAKDEVSVSVKPINLKTLSVGFSGITSFMQHKFSKKVAEIMRATQEEGKAAAGKKKRDPKDFDALYEAATYKTSTGKFGIPCAAFRAAIISACRTVGYKMVHAKLAVFVEADGVDAEDGTPLVFISGKREKDIRPARNSNGSVDLRCRPIWNNGWSGNLRVTYDADMLSASDVVNLISRAGLQVGVGEGRPDSKQSAGIGFGRFKVETGKGKEA